MRETDCYRITEKRLRMTDWEILKRIEENL